MSTRGVERFSFESFDFSDTEILQCRKLYLLLMGPEEMKDLSKGKEFAQQIEKSVVLKFQQTYKTPANEHVLTLNPTGQSQFFELMKLSIEIADHKSAIRELDRRELELDRQDQQILTGYGNELSRDLGNRGNSSTSGKRERKKSTCTIV